MTEPITSRFANLFKDFFDSEKVAGLILVFCAIVSLVIANSAFGDQYVHFFHRKLDLSFADVRLNYSIEHWVNDGLMAIFFLLVGLEVEREIYIGELSKLSDALLPVVAAVGGMVVPLGLHMLFNLGTETQSGFAIPMATDIAFALGVLALVGNRVPTSVKVFLTALAIIDDVGAIFIIAIFYTKTVSFTFLAAAIGIFIVIMVFNRFRIRNLAFYLLPGVVMWYCFLQSGVHATIAGVLLAFAVPFHENDDRNVSYKLQHFLHKPVAFIIVPIFALVNTAIVLKGDIGSSLTSPNSIGIMAGLFVGKVAGIFLFPFLLVKSGKASLNPEISWSVLVGIGFLGGIGFTMSMFITNLAFDDPQLVTTSKLSILIASAISAVTGVLVFLFSRPNATIKTT